LEVINVNVKRFPVLDERLNFLPATNPKEFLASFERVIKVQKPRLVLIATPDNPTSQVWPPDIIEKMCEITLKHHVWFAMDLAYRSIYFGQKPSYFGLSFRDYENLITIHSFSKDFSLLGLRSSYIIAREDVIENLESVEGARSLSPVTLAQLALLKYFARSTSQEIDEYFDENRKRYLKASETMVSSLYKNIPTPIILTPTGGFYLVLNIANYGFRSDVEFAALLSQREKTAVVPGSVFGSASVGSLRLSYAPVVDQPNLINEGIKRLARCRVAEFLS
jgi:aspartate/methionine/tyrosine aminotransferase